MRIAKTIQTSTIILLLALAVAGTAYAATTLEVGIPGVEGAAPGDTVSSVPTYIKYLYYFVLGLVGIAGFSSLVFWGAVWAGSGIVDKKAQAIAGIKNTLTGIGIALTAFILLNTINPDLIVIKTPNLSDANIKSNEKTTIETMTEAQLELAYQACQNKDQASCGADTRCGWAISGYQSFCTSRQATTCFSFTTQYERCEGESKCQKSVMDACNNSGCQFSSNSCNVRNP